MENNQELNAAIRDLALLIIDGADEKEITLAKLAIESYGVVSYNGEVKRAKEVAAQLFLKGLTVLLSL